MKQVVFGGLLFIGGSIMYAVGALGFADIEVQAPYMETPQYIGIFFMLASLALGVFGLTRKER